VKRDAFNTDVQDVQDGGRDDFDVPACRQAGVLFILCILV
jgi:hypothetical protein